MALKPMKACIVPGCPAVIAGATKGGKCPKHTAEIDARKREQNRVYSRTKRVAHDPRYTRVWRETAAAVLRAHPYCQSGLHPPDSVPLSQEVHHIVPVNSEGGRALVYRTSNLLAVCRACHIRLEARLASH